MCVHVAHPYGAEIQQKVPFKYKGSWGPDAPDRGYGWRFCGPGPSASFTNECQEFCDGIGDCIAVAAGGCCFPYRARCGGRTDLSNSQSYIYYEVELPWNWGWGFLATLAVLWLGYIAGGLLVTKWGGGGGGWTHRHATHWRALWGLVADGVHFARGGYQTLGPAATKKGNSTGRVSSTCRPPREFSNKVVSGDKRKDDKRGKEKKSKEKSIRIKEQRKGSSKEVLAAAVAATAAAATATVEQPPPQPQLSREWQPTRSAVGCLAVGARETGVKVQL